MPFLKKLKHFLKSIPRYIKFVLGLPLKLLPHRLIKRLSPRNRKIVNLGFITLLLVLVPYFIWTLLTPGGSDAAWWNDNWAYRQTASITNSNGSNLTNFQVLVEVDTASLITARKMKSDCSDARFTDEGGNLLPYWIETGANGCNDSETNIWVKVPNVYTTGTTIFFYYGNSSAQAFQNGNEVFELFDDFSGSTLDTSKWEEGTIGATSGTNFTVSGGLLSGGNSNRFIRSNAVYTGDYTAEARSFTTTDNANGYMTIGFFVGINDDFGILDHNNSSYYRNDSNWVGFAVDGTGQWTKNSTKVVGTNATYARIGETSGSSTATVTNSGLASEYVRISARYDNSAMDQNYVATWDWITVRKAAATDPTASFGSEEKSEGPVLYFAFDEGTGTTTKDGSSSRLTGTLSAPPSWIPESQCIVGSCLYFDGSDTANNETVIYTETATSPTNITGDVTISAWIKPSSDYGDASGAILRNGQGADLVYSMFYDYNNKRPFFHWYDGDFPAVQGTTNSVPLDEWSFLSIVRESNVVSFYVNGKLTNSASVTTPTVPSTRMAIGRTDNVDVQQDYTGYLDELKIYPYARSADQILVDFNTRGGNATSTVLGATDFETLSQGLVGYWKMDQSSWNGSAGEVIDSSGMGNNGTAISGAEASTAAKFGNAGYFDGVDNRIGVPSNASLDFDADGEYSVAFWMKPNSIPNGSANGTSLFFKSNTGNGMAVYMGTTGLVLPIYLGSGNCASTNCNNNTGTSVPTTSWSHIAVTYNKGESKIYLNGELKSTLLVTGALDNTSSDIYLSAGNQACSGSQSCAYPGNLDETRVYNRALSSQDVANLYNFAPGPVAYYPFEETTGATTTADRSSNGLNLTLSNSPSFVLGKYGRAIKFSNGTTQGASLANSLYQQNNYTYGFWFRFDVPYDESYRQIFALHGASDRMPGLWRFASGNCFHAVQDPGNMGFGCIGPTGNSTYWEVGKWYYYSQAKNGTTLTAYVNGNQIATTTVGNPMTTSATPTMYLGDSPSYRAAGITMDEFRLYNYARTPAQITQDMNAGHPTGGSPIASQVGYWKFNQGYGTLANNSGNAGASVDGTITTCTWLDEAKFSRGLNCNGGGYVSFGSNTALDAPQFTYSFWMKPGNQNSGGAYENILMGRETYLTNGFRMGIGYASSSTGQISFWSTQSGGTIDMTSNKVVTDGKWHYVAISYDGTTARMYIDGKLEDTSVGTYVVPTGVGLVLNGGVGGTTPSNSQLDEFKFYSSALDAAQIKLDYNQSSSQVLGSFGLNADGTASNSAAQTYCVPGDFTTANCKPIGEWNFEEGRGVTANDTSTNGRTGTLTDGPIWTTGKVGKALSFDGSDDYVSLANGPDLSSGDWTMEAWIYPTAYGVSQWRHIFGAEPQTFAFGITSGSLAVTNVTVADCTASSITPSLNTWSYVAVSFVDSSNTLTYYVNGSRANAVTCATTPTAGRLTEYIGSSFAYSSPFAGKIDQARIYNYVRSPAQIAWDYNKGKPVGHWKLDECQGSVANDSSEFRTNGAITIGGSGSQTSVGTCQTASTAWGNGVTGKFNYSLNFDGTDDYITVPDTASLSVSSGPSSWFAWIKGNSISSTASIIRKQSNDYVLAAVGGMVWCELQPNSVNSGKTMSNSQWYHVGCVFDGTTLRSYLNGVQQGSAGASANTDSNSSLYIGSLGGGSQFFNGQIDDVQIFGFGLTSTQVKNLFNQSSAIRFGPLQGAP